MGWIVDESNLEYTERDNIFNIDFTKVACASGNIRTNALLGSRFLNISASSDIGVDGQVDLAEDINPTVVQESVALPNPMPQRVQGCRVPGGESSFAVQRASTPKIKDLIATSYTHAAFREA